MFLATKTDPEREDEEADRLVRPAPKKKPPRRDLRREQMDLERDPDLEGESDPDMSLNYKDVGGSASAARVFRRWAKEKQKLVPVRHKGTGEVVMVSPETLKDTEKSKDYEPLKDEEKQKAVADAKAKEEKTKEKAKKKEEKAKDEKGEGEATPEQAAVEVQEWMGTGEHKKGAFKRFLSAIPTSHEDAMGEPTVLDPETKKRVSFEKLPPVAQKNLIDTYSGQQEQAKEAKATLGKQRAASTFMDDADAEVSRQLWNLGDPNSKESLKLAELEKDHDLTDIRPEKVFPELKGKLPKNLTSLGQARDIVVAARTYNGMSEADKAGIPAPKREEPESWEQQESILLVAETFPPEFAADIIAQNLHPNDVKAMVRHYHSAKAEPVEDVQDYATKAAEHYALDPEMVRPPEKWGGKEFNRMPSEKKAEAMRQHQMKVIGASLAAGEKLTHELSLPGPSGKPRVHPMMAERLAGYMLIKSKDPVKAASLGKEIAEAVFDSTLRDFPDTRFLSGEGTAKELLEKLDPGAQMIAQGFLQASDYHTAKDLFLGGRGDDEEEGISEHDSPSQILSGLKKAWDFFKKSPASGETGHRSSGLFSNRVLDRILALAPKKHAVVQAGVDKAEAKEYESNLKKWKKSHTKWTKSRQKHDKTQPFGGAGKGALPFPDLEPVEPTPPAHYGASVKRRKSRSKAAARVAQRYVSTYPGWLAMDQSVRKTAIYHGVEPYADDPGTYPDWKPAHQRDLSEDDFAQILTSAKEWLASPVLTKHVDGMERDQQLRHALDLSIQASKYNRKIHPAVYNMLLARLAGEPEPGPGQTLQTVRGSTCAPCRAGDIPLGQGPGTTENTMPTKLSAEQSKQASDVLGRIDDLAKTVQANHASWGMSFDDAKTVVNDLDKTADIFERMAFGEESLQRRQQEVLAKVIKREPDEGYMDTFQNPHQPVQTDADEPYMGAYGDDQSSAVADGKEETGEALAP